MKRLVMSALIAAGVLASGSAGVSAAGNGPLATGNPLVRAWTLAISKTTTADVWFADDGCTGGSSERDPGFFVVPLTAEPVLTSHCTVSDDAPLVFVPATVLCWEPTVAEAKLECDGIWDGSNTDGPGVLLSASVVIDGRSQKLPEYRTSQSSFTFPADTVIGTPGETDAVYAISRASIAHLHRGRHTVRMQFAYASGFAGDTTFIVDVVD